MTNNSNDFDDNLDKTTKTTDTNAYFPTAWVMMIGLIVAVGPLSIDMYLPALPVMADEFGVTTANVARSVPAYFIGLVIGQLFYGPWSDRVGRVLPMYVGMAIFVAASVVCATASSEIVLFVARTLQALGACATGVVTRAAIRDRLSAVASARAFSLTILVMGLAPILAPSLGAFVLKFADWRTIFWFLAVYGVVVAVLTKLFLGETHPKQNRTTAPMSQSFKGYIELFKDGDFILPAVAGGLLQGAFFIYLTIVSQLFMQEFGLSQTQFATAFGANAFGFIALTQVNQFLTKRFHLVKLFRFGAIMQCLFASCLLILGMTMGTNAPFLLVFLSIFCCIAFLGFTQPNASAIALAFQKHRAGLAAAAQGSLQFSVGIFGGFLLSLIDASAIVKLGVVVFCLTLAGVILSFKISSQLDFSKAN